MGRFAEPTLERLVLPGGCQCPGTPHAEDEVWIRRRLGASALARVGRAALEGAVQMDPFADRRRLALEAIVRWNVVWRNPLLADVPEGAPIPDELHGIEEIVPVPVNEAAIEAMGEDIVWLTDAIDRVMNGGPDPNSSGGRSRGSSPARRSRTRTRTPTPGT